MRNYARFLYLRATIEERHQDGTLVGTFENTFIGENVDDLFASFGLYATAFQGSNVYSLTNIEEAEYRWIQLSRDNINQMFKLLATAFDDCVGCWVTGGGFSGSLPRSAFFEELFVTESPRQDWSNGL